MHPIQLLCICFAPTSFGVSIMMLTDPISALALFGVRIKAASSNPSSDTALVSAMYGAAVFGEGCLQTAAFFRPDLFLRGLLLSMVPYKLFSVMALAILCFKSAGRSNARPRTEFISLSCCWGAPIVLLAAARVFGGPLPF